MLITFGLMALPFLMTRRIICAICIVAPLLPLPIWLFQRAAVLVFYSLAFMVFMGFRCLPDAGELWIKARKNRIPLATAI